jgi:hypothetical protein
MPEQKALEFTDGKWINKAVYPARAATAAANWSATTRPHKWLSTTKHPAIFMSDIAPALFFAIKFTLDKTGKGKLFDLDLAFTGAWLTYMVSFKQVQNEETKAKASWIATNIGLPVFFFAKYIAEKIEHEKLDNSTAALAALWAAYKVIPLLSQMLKIDELRRTPNDKLITRLQGADGIKNKITESFRTAEAAQIALKVAGMITLLTGIALVDTNIALSNQLGKATSALLIGSALMLGGYAVERSASISRAESTINTRNAVNNTAIYRAGLAISLASSVALVMIAVGKENNPSEQKYLELGAAVMALVGFQSLSLSLKNDANSATLDMNVTNTTDTTTKETLDRSSHWYSFGSNVMHHATINQGLLLAAAGAIMAVKHFKDARAYLIPGSGVSLIILSILAVNSERTSAAIYATTLSKGHVKNIADGRDGAQIDATHTDANNGSDFNETAMGKQEVPSADCLEQFPAVCKMC